MKGVPSLRYTLFVLTPDPGMEVKRIHVEAETPRRAWLIAPTVQPGVVLEIRDETNTIVWSIISDKPAFADTAGPKS